MKVKVYLERNHVENCILTQCTTDTETRYFYCFGNMSCFYDRGFFGTPLHASSYTDEDGNPIFSDESDEFAEHVAKLIRENPAFLENFNSIDEFGNEEESFRDMTLEEIDRRLNYDDEGRPNSCGEFYEWTLVREFESDEEF